MRRPLRSLWRLCQAAARAARDAAADPAHAAELARRSFSVLRSQDLGVALGLSRPGTYADWIRRFEPGPDELRSRLRRLARRPLISVVVPSSAGATRTVASVRAQVYDGWELLVAGENLTRLEAATEVARGEMVAVADPGAELAPHALLEMAEKLALRPDADLLTSDEDRRDQDGTRVAPCFKPQFDPDLLLARDYLSRFCALRPEIARKAGGFRTERASCAGYDLVLRAASFIRTPVHAPRVLVHALRENVPSEALAALRDLHPAAGPGLLPDTFRVRPRLPQPAPAVSVIVPTRNQPELLRRCLDGLARTRYPGPLETIVVDNGSDRQDALALLGSIETGRKVRVLRDDRPFNFSALNNLAVRETRGELLCFLNDDVEPLDGGWLEEMAVRAMSPGSGAVGARLLHPGRTVQHAGIVVGLFGIAGHLFRGLPAGDPGDALGRPLVARGVSAVTAACLVVRREAFLAAGGFDESLAVAFNDVDLCLRLRGRGLRNLYTPHAELIHAESLSRGADDSPEKRARRHREERLLRSRWQIDRFEDPFHSPNLSLRAFSAELAWPPRD